MKKKDLRLATGMSTTSLAKLSKNEHVGTAILTEICKVLECDIGDIMEVTPEQPPNSKKEQDAWNNTHTDS